MNQFLKYWKFSKFFDFFFFRKKLFYSKTKKKTSSSKKSFWFTNDYKIITTFQWKVKFKMFLLFFFLVIFLKKTQNFKFYKFSFPLFIVDRTKNNDRSTSPSRKITIKQRVRAPSVRAPKPANDGQLSPRRLSSSPRTPSVMLVSSNEGLFLLLFIYYYSLLLWFSLSIHCIFKNLFFISILFHFCRTN